MEGVVRGVYKSLKRNNLYNVYGAGNFDELCGGESLLSIGRHSETLSKIEIYYNDSQKKFILKGDSGDLIPFLDMEHIIYQALYDSEEFGKNAYWIRPKEMFFGNTNLNGIIIPRFEFIHGRIVVL